MHLARTVPLPTEADPTAPPSVQVVDAGPRGPIELLEHGRGSDGPWLRFACEGRLREPALGLKRLEGVGVQGRLEVHGGSAGSMAVEVRSGSSPDAFVARLLLEEGGRWIELDHGNAVTPPVPPGVVPPAAVAGPLGEAARLLRSERVVEVVLGVQSGRARPSSRIGRDCREAWMGTFHTCLDPSAVHACDDLLWEVSSCILAAIARL